ncbi:sugar transferase [Lentimicrobium sp.]|jgi:lipopolysaccharide/colanic/teichoic acid biosynthesis glycosyltransferase|uniref:sugar transferase n=3 Tax=Lentimicrobium sp. TaxID=2034841 RepID=UPI002BF9504B|nr:sugar transferase [Lentimicrobium sp.]MCO5262311.1 sugar transferase [Lentimicrobium sp.]HRW69638.1 sugar transferase [Lentimicrobium sp.]
MYRYFKRIGDILFSSLGMLLFLPFFIPLAIALKLTGEGYIFYLQERRGYKNKKFRIWKFATMLKASPSLGTGSITLKNDWRLTPLGKYLRGSKVNEIPQLINIFLGEMSVVGPRPLMEVDFQKFSPEIQDQFYQCKPGLTGIASIVFRDEEQFYENTEIDPHEYDRLYIAPYKGALEKWYREHQGFRTDMLIIVLTAAVIIFPENNRVFRWFRDLPPIPVFGKKEE